MSRIGMITKQPAEILDYDVDYADWMTDGDVVVLSRVLLPGADTVVIDVFTSAAAVKLWISGGVDGQEGTIEITTTTRDGRVKQDELSLRIMEVT